MRFSRDRLLVCCSLLFFGIGAGPARADLLTVTRTTTIGPSIAGTFSFTDGGYITSTGNFSQALESLLDFGALDLPDGSTITEAVLTLNMADLLTSSLNVTRSGEVQQWQEWVQTGGHYEDHGYWVSCGGFCGSYWQSHWVYVPDYSAVTRTGTLGTASWQEAFSRSFESFTVGSGGGDLAGMNTEIDLLEAGFGSALMAGDAVRVKADASLGATPTITYLGYRATTKYDFWDDVLVQVDGTLRVQYSQPSAAVPEPSSIALLGAVVVFVGYRLKRSSPVNI